MSLATISSTDGTPKQSPRNKRSCNQVDYAQLRTSILTFFMDGPASRWVVVDDTSSDINYIGGPWFSDVGNWDSVGAFGMPYLSTQHGTRSKASFTFEFTGSAVAVVGSNLGSRTTYWTCSVDGVALESTSNSPICTSPCNNSLFCNATALEDGHHTLTVNATPTGNQTFWFDRVEYVASQQVSREQKSIRVTSWDPELISTRGKVFTFYGVSASWYGTIRTLIESTALNLSWSMDQGDTNYTWDWNASSLSNPSYPLQNQKFFETPTYPMGMHTLRVTDALDLKYLIVKNGTVPSSTTSEFSSPSATKSGTPGHVVGGIIAGGVVGGVLVFGLVVMVIYFCRRRLYSQRGIVDKPFFDQKSVHFPYSRRSHPVQRTSRLLPSYSPFLAYDPNSLSRIQVQTKLNEPSNSNSSSSSTSTWTPTTISGTDGFRSNHSGDHGPPPSIPSIAQRDDAVGVVQVNSQPHIGQVSVTRAPTAVVHLPPEYTPD